ncbi:MSP1 protein [Nymphaea thermarum]|nr:MSP1 protein [Nymphaea thermarum]
MYARRLKCRCGIGSSLVRCATDSFRFHDYEIIKLGRSPNRQLSRFQSTYGCGNLRDLARVRGYEIGQVYGRKIRVSSRSALAGTVFLRDCGGGLSPTRLLVSVSGNGWSSFRLYSSEGDGRSAGEGEQAPAKKVDGRVDGSSSVAKSTAEKKKSVSNHSDAHARLCEQDQQDWLKNERLFYDSKKRESPFLTRRQRFKNEFMRRLIPWEKISVTWDNFPYQIHENTKNILIECASTHFKHQKFAAHYGSRLSSSSGRILLQSAPGTELYRERIVRALAHGLQVPLLVLDSSILAPNDIGRECASDIETDDENEETGEEGTSESEVDDENEATNEDEWASSSEVKSEDEDEAAIQASAEVLKKLVPYSIEEFEKRVSGVEAESASSAEKSDAETTQQSKRPFKKGDRVKYIGTSVNVDVDNRQLASGERGEVYEVNGDQVAVIFDDSSKKTKEGHTAEKGNVKAAKPSVYWIDVQDIEHDLDTQAEDWYIAIEALRELLPSLHPVIVYFPDSYQWLSRAVTKSNRKEFLHKVEQTFESLSGSIVLICGQSKVESGPKEKEKLTMVLPHFGRIGKLPVPLKRLTEGLRETKAAKDRDANRIFTNVLTIPPPKEEELLRVFNKQVAEDRKIAISRSNLRELHKVLEENDLSCPDLLHVKSDDVILTKQKAEKVVGWARNHYLSSCLLPSIRGERLSIPCRSMDVALSRLREQEFTSRKPSQSLKSLAKDEYESNFVSAVVPADEIGVKFDDIGALEDVKKTLNELVILPMRRPELFAHGNLLRPCKGILLFGPPGTGKTLLAKALATEAGANFISITGSTLTSKWFGDAEKLTKALFSFASKLAPVIIFVDEVDSLLGARGGAFEHEATRRMRNEFMAAWDGLRSKDTQRILILGATNRPFDLDDAVIRRLPRRIYVDLPDAENRMKILSIILSPERLETNFKFDELANATEGYSGSDLKNLCIAAAYRPVQELLEEEKVGASIAYDATSMNDLRKWNEQYGEGGSRRRSPFGFGN